MRTLMSISTIIVDRNRITRIKVLYDAMFQNSKLNKKIFLFNSNQSLDLMQEHSSNLCGNYISDVCHLLFLNPFFFYVFIFIIQSKLIKSLVGSYSRLINLIIG